MTSRSSDIDFHRIRTLHGSQHQGFEEFCCQLAARYEERPEGARFFRLRGEGGDGGVESYWDLPNGEEWGWQAKFLFTLKKPQLDRSVRTALEMHPKLTRYFVCLPFDLTGPTGRPKGKRTGKSQVEKFAEYVAVWEKLAASKGMKVKFMRWGATELFDRREGSTKQLK